MLFFAFILCAAIFAGANFGPFAFLAILFFGLWLLLG